MSTPFSLVVVVILVGLGVGYGVQQSTISQLRKDVDAQADRLAEREKHGGRVDTQLATMDATLIRVDKNVERLLQLNGRATA